MALPTGTWKINSNGIEGSLAINTVNPDGSVVGTINIDIHRADRITGFWDETSQELTFSPIPLNVGGDSPVLPIYYKGYLLRTPTNPIPGQDVTCTLAGFFQSVQIDFPGGSSRRNIFGWFAQFNMIN